MVAPEVVVGRSEVCMDIDAGYHSHNYFHMDVDNCIDPGSIEHNSHCYYIAVDCTVEDHGRTGSGWFYSSPVCAVQEHGVHVFAVQPNHESIKQNSSILSSNHHILSRLLTL